MTLVGLITCGAGSIGLAAASTPVVAHSTVFNIYDAPQVPVSVGLGGARPNADATDPVISRDGWYARDVAYSSRATNLTGDRTGGVRNVFLAERSGGYGSTGTPWSLGRTVLASRGLGGAAPNGSSWGPAIDGTDRHAPRCLGFVSTASNLVHGDHAHSADVFLRSFRTGRLRRIRVPGDAIDVAVANRCQVVAFSTTHGVYVRAAGHTRRVVKRRDVHDLDLAINGSVLVFSSKGHVISYRVKSHRRHRVGNGRRPSVDGYGRYVVYESRGRVIRSTPTGRGHSLVHHGGQPRLTSGGHFVYWVTGGYVRLTVKHQPVGYCPASSGSRGSGASEGRPRHPVPSAHGNYLVFSCTFPGRPARVVLQYLGPKAKGG